MGMPPAPQGKRKLGYDSKAGQSTLEPQENTCGKLGLDFPMAGPFHLTSKGGRSNRPKMNLALELASSLEARKSI